MPQVMPTVTNCKRFEGSSTYSRDFGPLGSDPMQHATTVPTQQTLASTTRELNEGTTRAAHHPPGYTGFVPAAATNPAAVEQAAGHTCRPDAKVRLAGEGDNWRQRMGLVRVSQRCQMMGGRTCSCKGAQMMSALACH